MLLLPQVGVTGHMKQSESLMESERMNSNSNINRAEVIRNVFFELGNKITVSFKFTVFCEICIVQGLSSLLI